MVIPQTVRGPKRFYWDIVCNNYTVEECENVKVIFREIGDAHIIGKEIGESGTPHLQMMLKLKKGNYKSYLIGKLGKRFSIREGRNIEAMKAYCMKDNVYDSNNVDRIQNSMPLNERVNKIFNVELVNNKKLYEKFMREVDPNMDGYLWLKEYLESRINDSDYVRRNVDYDS